MNFPEPICQILTGEELRERLTGRSEQPYYASTSSFGIPGRDHASTLLYLQTVEANHKGNVKAHNNGQHMRWKLRSGPFPPGWEPAYGSRMWDGTVLGDHDDYDCLDDLEALGLLVNIGTGFQPVVRLTKRGHDACAAMIAERSATKY